MRPSFTSSSLVLVAYSGGILLALLCLGAFGPVSALVPDRLLRFDALHYQGIMQHGYISESSAFFPLFPYIWRLFGFNAIEISVFNGCIFLFCSSLLFYDFRTNIRTILIFISLPSLFFVWLPYTESMFFLGATGILIGLRREQRYWIIIGLAWCTLARPAFTALLPALLVTLSLRHLTMRQKVIQGSGYVITCCSALAVVAYTQFAETGSWTGFYTAQQGYGNTLKIPNLPLTSWGGGAIVRLDSVALLIGLCCAALLIKVILQRVRGNGRSPRPEVILSLGYMAGVAAIALLLRGGELYSLNRFIFATPFAFVLLDFAFKNHLILNIKQGIILLSILMAYSFLFGSYVHIRTIIWFFSTYLYVTVLLFSPLLEQRKNNLAFTFIFILAALIQIYFFQRYLNNEWVA